MMRHRPQCPGAGCSSSVCSKASNALYITPGPQLKGPAESFRNLAAGTRKVDIDYRTENSGYTAYIKNARFIGLPLE